MKKGYKMKKIIRLLPLILAVIMMLLNGCGPIKAIKNSKLSAGIYLCAELHSEKD